LSQTVFQEEMTEHKQTYSAISSAVAMMHL
jgi:hypothetical protein